MESSRQAHPHSPGGARCRPAPGFPSKSGFPPRRAGKLPAGTSPQSGRRPVPTPRRVFSRNQPFPRAGLESSRQAHPHDPGGARCRPAAGFPSKSGFPPRRAGKLPAGASPQSGRCPVPPRAGRNSRGRRCPPYHQKSAEAYASALIFLPCCQPISWTSTAFWACRRFSASSKISSACFSKVSSVISSPRWAGRQCCTMASFLATFINSSLI